MPELIIHNNNLHLVNTPQQNINKKDEAKQESKFDNSGPDPYRADNGGFSMQQKESPIYKEEALIEVEKNKDSIVNPMDSNSQPYKHSQTDDKKINNDASICNPPDMSMSQENSGDGLKLELHKIRLENAKIRLNIENTKKYTVKLQAEIDKSKKNITKSEKTKKIVIIYIKIGR